MNDEIIRKFTERFLSMNKEKSEYVHEYLCALENSKAILENRITRSLFKKSVETQVNSMANFLNKLN